MQSQRHCFTIRSTDTKRLLHTQLYIRRKEDHKIYNKYEPARVNFHRFNAVFNQSQAHTTYSMLRGPFFQDCVQDRS